MGSRGPTNTLITQLQFQRNLLSLASTASAGVGHVGRQAIAIVRSIAFQVAHIGGNVFVKTFSGKTLEPCRDAKELHDKVIESWVNTAGSVQVILKARGDNPDVKTVEVIREDGKNKLVLYCPPEEPKTESKPTKRGGGDPDEELTRSTLDTLYKFLDNLPSPTTFAAKPKIERDVIIDTFREHLRQIEQRHKRAIETDNKELASHLGVIEAFGKSLISGLSKEKINTKHLDVAMKLVTKTLDGLRSNFDISLPGPPSILGDFDDYVSKVSKALADAEMRTDEKTRVARPKPAAAPPAAPVPSGLPLVKGSVPVAAVDRPREATMKPAPPVVGSIPPPPSRPSLGTALASSPSTKSVPVAASVADMLGRPAPPASTATSKTLTATVSKTLGRPAPDSSISSTSSPSITYEADKFSQIYTGSPSDESDLEASFRSTLDISIDQGKHLIIFGYGYSGSGKTYTLKKLCDIISSGLGYQATLTDVYDIRAKYDGKAPPPGTPHAKIIASLGIAERLVFMKDGELVNPTAPLIQRLQNAAPTEREKFIKENWQLFIFNSNPETETILINSIRDSARKAFPDVELPSSEQVRSSIDKTLSTIYCVRRLLGFIKPTSNNLVSSRSHHFYTLRVKKEGLYNECKVTFVDMGGREEPFEIFEKARGVSTTTDGAKGSYNLDTLFTTPQGPDIALYKDIYQLLPLSKGETLADAMPYPIKYGTRELQCGGKNQCVNLLRATTNEGIMINETINELQYFIRYNVFGDSRFDTFNKETLTDMEKFINALKETPQMFKKSDPKTGAMYKALAEITELDKHKDSTDKKHRNFMFLMVCCVRPGSKYCDAARRTITFGASISNKELNNLPPDSARLVKEVIEICNQLIVPPPPSPADRSTPPLELEPSDWSIDSHGELPLPPVKGGGRSAKRRRG